MSPLILDRDIKDFREMAKRELKDLVEWEKGRVIKKCKTCGGAYSFERGTTDPRECMGCRDAEGELVF